MSNAAPAAAARRCNLIERWTLICPQLLSSYGTANGFHSTCSRYCQPRAQNLAQNFVLWPKRVDLTLAHDQHLVDGRQSTWAVGENDRDPAASTNALDRARQCLL